MAKSSEGTGGALTAALAFGIAHGKPLRHPVMNARIYVQQLIRREFEEYALAQHAQNHLASHPSF